jgi:hypothetical protein
VRHLHALLRHRCQLMSRGALQGVIGGDMAGVTTAWSALRGNTARLERRRPHGGQHAWRALRANTRKTQGCRCASSVQVAITAMPPQGSHASRGNSAKRRPPM